MSRTDDHRILHCNVATNYELTTWLEKSVIGRCMAVR